jgi:cysteine desulfurase
MPPAGEPPPRIYADHAATTPLRPEVAAAMLDCAAGRFGNPSSLHAEGRAAREALESARERIRSACRAGEFDLVFCSSGTEADHLAIVGSFLAMARESAPGAARRELVLASAVEHAAVHGAAELVADLGGMAATLPVDEDGRLRLDAVREALTDEVALVSVMAANNETGALQPIEAVGELARARGIRFHVDAVQALGKVPLELDNWAADLVAIAAHKVYGPRGIAALLVRRGTKLAPLLRGGAQEGGLRAGTECVAAAVGFACAVELAGEEREATTRRLGRLRDELRGAILARFPAVRVNTPEVGALATHLNLSFPRVEGESLVKLLDWHGVAASTGSACNVGGRKPSHVLRAMGRSDAEVRGSLRLSLGRNNTGADVAPLLAALEASVRQLEALAPAAP